MYLQWWKATDINLNNICQVYQARNVKKTQLILLNNQTLNTVRLTYLHQDFLMALMSVDVVLGSVQSQTQMWIVIQKILIIIIIIIITNIYVYSF